MNKVDLVEIHVHKLECGNRFRITVTNGNNIVDEETVLGTNNRDDLVWKWCDLYNTVDVILHDHKRKEFKYSVIPSIPVLEEAEAEEFFETQQEFVYRRVVQAVSEGVETSLESIRLFELNGTENYITSQREHWGAGLISALKFFESKEDYEMCDRISKLQNQL